jgi:hypothetical protein
MRSDDETAQTFSKFPLKHTGLMHERKGNEETDTQNNTTQHNTTHTHARTHTCAHRRDECRVHFTEIRRWLRRLWRISISNRAFARHRHRRRARRRGVRVGRRRVSGGRAQCGIDEPSEAGTVERGAHARAHGVEAHRRVVRVRRRDVEQRATVPVGIGIVQIDNETACDSA